MRGLWWLLRSLWHMLRYGTNDPIRYDYARRVKTETFLVPLEDAAEDADTDTR